MQVEPEKAEDSVAGCSIESAYQAINQHWAHAEQERWSILYNFLTASSILLLAWATIFGTDASTIRATVLALLSLGGMIISGLWIMIGCRVNTFIRKYGELGEAAEVRLHIDGLGPFHGGENLRHDKRGPKTTADTLQWVGTLIPSRYFVAVIPGIFLLVYLILFVLSFWS